MAIYLHHLFSGHITKQLPGKLGPRLPYCQLCPRGHMRRSKAFKADNERCHSCFETFASSGT